MMIHRRPIAFLSCLLAATPTVASACAVDDAVAFRWSPPLAGPTATLERGFGVQRHPVLGIDRLHGGLRWRADMGREVRAAAAGRVVAAERMGELGNTIVIDHGSGWQTRYAHLRSMAVHVGPCINAATVIGMIGQTGLTPGPGLYFEVSRDGQSVDPALHAAP